MEELRYSSAIRNLFTIWSGQLHTPTSLYPKETALEEVGWVPGPSGILWRKLSFSYLESNSDTSVVKPVASSLYRLRYSGSHTQYVTGFNNTHFLTSPSSESWIIFLELFLFVRLFITLSKFLLSFGLCFNIFFTCLSFPVLSLYYPKNTEKDQENLSKDKYFPYISVSVSC
jgi:hypothetical protein